MTTDNVAPEKAASALRHLEERKKALQQQILNVDKEINRTRKHLEGALEPGEAVPDGLGRFYYLGETADGKADVNRAALDRDADRLRAIGLHPRTETVYPGVTLIRKNWDAIKSIGLDPHQYLFEAPRRMGLRVKTLEDAA